MSDSILTSTKKVLGIDSTYTAFDADITLHINSVLSTLEQLGVITPFGFTITGITETWTDLLGGDPRLNAVKTYVYLRVRLLFDPPTTAHLIASLKEQVQELEWRLNVTAEHMYDEVVVEGGLVLDPNSTLVLDGGTP